MSSPVSPLAADAILLHIGPHKTGSTAVQSALFARQDELTAYGVAYPGSWRRITRPGRALLGWAPQGREVPPISVWDDFAAEIRALDSTRVCISTEDLSRISDPAVVEKLVADLGRDRLEVVAVARPYHRVLPSHWQERVKGFLGTGYEDWLRSMLTGDLTDHRVRSFWRAHDVETMSSLWRSHLDPQRFTLVVTDDSDRRLLTHTFEQLLGLPADYLTLDRHANASLGTASLELLRRVNVAAAQRGWSPRVQARLVREGLARGLQEAPSRVAEPALPSLPAWAVPDVRARTERRLAAIRASGMRVLGDPARLRLPEGYRPSCAADLGPPPRISIDAVVAGIEAVIGQIDAHRPGSGKRDGR